MPELRSKGDGLADALSSFAFLCPRRSSLGKCRRDSSGCSASRIDDRCRGEPAGPCRRANRRCHSQTERAGHSLPADGPIRLGLRPVLGHRGSPGAAGLGRIVPLARPGESDRKGLDRDGRGVRCAVFAGRVPGGSPLEILCGVHSPARVRALESVGREMVRELAQGAWPRPCRRALFRMGAVPGDSTGAEELVVDRQRPERSLLRLHGDGLAGLDRSDL